MDRRLFKILVWGLVMVSIIFLYVCYFIGAN